MAKAITKTTVKMSVTFNRVALVIKYVNGEVLKTACNRGSDTMSFARPAGSEAKTGKLNMKPLFVFVCKEITGENNGQRFERLAKFFETTTSIQDAIEKVTA